MFNHDEITKIIEHIHCELHILKLLTIHYRHRMYNTKNTELKFLFSPTKKSGRYFLLNYILYILSSKLFIKDLRISKFKNI